VGTEFDANTFKLLAGMICTPRAAKANPRNIRFL